MAGGAPQGNQNAVKAKRWQQAIDRALAKRCKGDAIAALDELAEKFLKSVDNGESNMFPGFKELGDRMDGKPAQALEHSGPDGGVIPLPKDITFTLVKPDA